MRYFLLAGWLLLGAAAGAGCHSASSTSSTAMPASQTERFDLDAAAGCPKGYPMMLDEGRFITSDGGSFPIPWGAMMDGSWGSSSSGFWAVGDETQPAPDSLELRWFSFTEDQFYQGRFLLPQQRIYELLKNGYYNRDKKGRETYNSFLVNLLPTGQVVVWLEGGSSERVYIGCYEARKIEYDFERFRPKANRTQALTETRAELPAAVHEQIAKGTLSAQPWLGYFKLYPWQLAFSQPLTLRRFAVRYVNAESQASARLPDTTTYLPTLLQPGPKPLPEFVRLRLSAPYGRERELFLRPFDEQETRHAFQTLAAAHPGQPLTLLLDTDEAVTKARLFVQAGSQRLELTKTKIEVYTATD